MSSDTQTDTSGDVPSSSSSSSSATRRSGGCPVKHDQNNFPSSQSSSSSLSSPWGSWFRISPSSPHNATSQTQTQTPCSSSSNTTRGSCPIQNGSIQSIEEAAKHAQTPQPGQTIPLSTHRTISTIPKANNIQNNNDNHANEEKTSTATAKAKATPIHQPSNNDKWVYPSEQQFYNAMKRKGWEIAPGTEATIPFVVQIHNAVNERGWREIRQWESLRDNDEPKLVKFLGRPKDLSPKARLYSMLWLRKEPFDRHDWYVSREDGSDMRRYVIDFYNGNEKTKIENTASSTAVAGGEGGKDGIVLPSMYLDVRPALDNTDAVCDHMKMFVKETFPGIASILFKRS